MKYIYAIIGESAQNISDKPMNLAGHLQMNYERPKGNFVAAENGEWVEIFTEDTERQWRNDELKLVASQESIWKHAYQSEMESYMQELADYTDKDGFPECERPARPSTVKGNVIII